MYKTLLVDASYFAYQMYFSGLATSLLSSQLACGFIAELSDLCNEHAIETLVVVLDKGHEAKDKIYADYKKRRKDSLSPEQRQEFSEQFKLLNELLSCLGVKFCFSNGVEADDVIAYLCEQRSVRVQGNNASIPIPPPILILSGDHDLYPLLSDDVSIWKSRKRVLYTVAEFKQDFPSLEPKQYRDMLVLMGCQSDNVPGVSGIGSKYAERLITKYGSLEGIKEAPEDDTVAARVLGKWDEVQLSRQLINFVQTVPEIVIQEPNLARVRKQLFAQQMATLIQEWSKIVGLSKL